MTPEQADTVSERLRQIEKRTPTQAGLFRRVFYGKPSKATAVKAKCLDCCCWQREEVRLCASVACPLWRVRSFQTKRGKAIPCGVDASGKQLIES